MYQADARGLERAEEDVGDELGHGGGAEVDIGAVVPRTLLAHPGREVDLEELDAAELEPTLDNAREGVSKHGDVGGPFERGVVGLALLCFFVVDIIIIIVVVVVVVADTLM